MIEQPAKDMPGLILSVPHTGTRFLVQLLGWEFMHSYEYMTPQDIENRGDIFVAPLRDPFEVWKTWYQRYGGRKYLMDPDHPKSFESAWRALAALDRRFDIIYVPVDHPRRDTQLAFLSDRLGVWLETDWEPVGARPAHKKEKGVIDKNLDWIYRMDRVAQFYG